MSRFVPLSFAVIGLLVFVPGVALLISTLHGLNSEDEVVALTPVASIPLDQVGKQPLSATNVVIPDTVRWKRIRREWGEPDFIISAVSSDRRVAFCLADLGLK